MCLTLCYRRGIIYDSHTCDVCRTCPHRLGGAGRCDDCQHYAGDDVCDLTKARVPRCRRCCQWNVARDRRIEQGGVVPLEAVDPVLVERAYRGDVGLLAEEWGLRADGVPVSETVVPLVYGVESSEWSEALGSGPESGWSCEG